MSARRERPPSGRSNVVSVNKTPRLDTKTNNNNNDNNVKGNLLPPRPMSGKAKPESSPRLFDINNKNNGNHNIYSPRSPPPSSRPQSAPINKRNSKQHKKNSVNALLSNRSDQSELSTVS